jgi:hypothetical protein
MSAQSTVVANRSAIPASRVMILPKLSGCARHPIGTDRT